MNDIIIICCICIVLGTVVFVIMSLPWTVTVLHVNVYIDCCIATVGDDSYGLGVDIFQRHVDVYIVSCFSYEQSHHSHCHDIP